MILMINNTVEVEIDSFIDEIEKDFGIDKPKKTRRTT